METIAIGDIDTASWNTRGRFTIMQDEVLLEGE